MGEAEARLGGTEDALREFDERLERADRDLRRALQQRQRHADTAREAREHIAHLTERARAADDRDADAAKKYRARRARKRAALKESEHGFATLNAQCEKLHRTKGQLEQAVAKLLRLRKRARWRRFLGRIRGIRDVDDTGAEANSHIPAPLLALGIVLAVVLVLGAVSIAAFDADADGGNPLARLFARFRGEEEGSGITTGESVDAGLDAAARFGYVRPRTVKPQERGPVPPLLAQLPVARLTATQRRITRPPELYAVQGALKGGWVFANIDGQGPPELVFSDYAGHRLLVYQRERTGGYTHLAAVDSSPNVAAMDGGDLNGDGWDDVVIGDQYGAITALISRGDGTFDRQTLHTAGNVSSVIRVVDVDGDGALDVVGAWNGTAVLPGKGDGTFAKAVYVNRLGRQNQLAVADFNDDGVLDIASSPNYLWIKPHPAELGLAITLLGPGCVPLGPPRVRQFGPALWRFAALDLDGANGMDLVAMHFTKPRAEQWKHQYRVVVLWNSGSGRFDVVPCGTTQSGTAVVVVDVDGDGRQDAIAGSHLFINTGRKLVRRDERMSPEYPFVFARTDFDGDAVVDVIGRVAGQRLYLFPFHARPNAG